MKALGAGGILLLLTTVAVAEVPDKRVINAIDSVATSMVAARYCDLQFEDDEARRALATVGYRADDADHVQKMEYATSSARAIWALRDGKKLQIECDLVWQSFGPDGLVRKGLLRK